jgi:hypothetical protein
MVFSSRWAQWALDSYDNGDSETMPFRWDWYYYVSSLGQYKPGEKLSFLASYMILVVVL